jgi:hypothetical protein
MLFLHALTGALIAVTPMQDTDTTFAVDTSKRLDVSNFSGEIMVHTWDRNEVRVKADHSRRDGIVVDETAAEVRVRANSWARWADEFEVEIDDDHVHVDVEHPRTPSIVDFELWVPAQMALELGGPYTDVTLDGTAGAVTVKVSEGDIMLRGVRGQLTARTVEGDINVQDVQGKMRLLSMDGEIIVEGGTGDIVAETTDGDIRLANVQSTYVEASSVDGDVWFAGPVAAQGEYLMTTHDGDVTVMIPEGASVRVTVATFDGDFETEFPVTLPERMRGRRFNFTLGQGSAQMEIEAFDGDIELLLLTDFRMEGMLLDSDGNRGDW